MVISCVPNVSAASGQLKLAFLMVKPQAQVRKLNTHEGFKQ